MNTRKVISTNNSSSESRWISFYRERFARKKEKKKRMTNTRWNDQIEFYASKRFAVTPAVKRLKREGSTNIEEFITRMIIFSETIEDIGGRYTRLLLAPMQPAIELILPSAARLGIRGAAFYLVQRPHLPLLSLSFRSHVPSPSTGDSPPTRIPRRIRAYIPFCFHFPNFFCISYIYIYTWNNYLKSGKRITNFFSDTWNQK